MYFYIRLFLSKVHLDKFKNVPALRLFAQSSLILDSRLKDFFYKNRSLQPMSERHKADIKQIVYVFESTQNI